MKPLTTRPEADVEDTALNWLEGLGWQVAHGLDISPNMPDEYGGRMFWSGGCRMALDLGL